MTIWTTEALANEFPELASVDIEASSVEGPHGLVPVRLYRGPEIVGALMWLHGGAFAFGDLDMPEAHWVSLSLAARGVAVCSVDYRLAIDGVHYPVPVDDALAAWEWGATTSHFVASGVPLHLGGASAGGCIAASTAKRIRDHDHRQPVSLVLIYPLAHGELPELSDDLQRTIAAAPADAMMFDANLTRELTRNYAGDDRLFTDPYAFPANGDLRGLPPTFIVNAEYDTLRASSEPFAAALAANGNEVVIETEPGTVHGHINEPRLDAARQTVDRMASWIVGR